MIAQNDLKPSLDSRPWYRNNTPDALYGALTAIEATLGVVLMELARRPSATATRTRLNALRLLVEAAADQEAPTTRFGTGSGEILDGRKDAIDTIFREAERLARQEA